MSFWVGEPNPSAIKVNRLHGARHQPHPWPDVGQWHGDAARVEDAARHLGQ